MANVEIQKDCDVDNTELQPAEDPTLKYSNEMVAKGTTRVRRYSTMFPP